MAAHPRPVVAILLLAAVIAAVPLARWPARPVLAATGAATPAVTAAPRPSPTPRPSPAAMSVADAAEAASACAAASAAMDARPPDGGPSSGLLTARQLGSAVLGDPLLAIDGDFVATATFVNPRVATGNPWDYGFALMAPDGRMRYAIVVDSLADAYRVVGDRYVRSVGSDCAYDAAPGGRNTLQLVVVGDRAVLLLNGEPIAPFFLPTGAASGELRVVAGLFVEDEEVGRTIALEDAAAWSLGD